MKDVRVPGCPSSEHIHRKAYTHSFETVFYEAATRVGSLLKCLHSRASPPLHTHTHFFLFVFVFLSGEVFDKMYPHCRNEKLDG